MDKYTLKVVVDLSGEDEFKIRGMYRRRLGAIGFLTPTSHVLVCEAAEALSAIGIDCQVTLEDGD